MSSRFRQNTAKHERVNSLTRLPDLLKQSKEVKALFSPVEPSAVGRCPHPIKVASMYASAHGIEDDLATCIWKVMSDFRQRTASEIFEVLRDTDVELATVQTLLNNMSNAGMFIRTKLPNPTSTTFVYLLKKGIEMTKIDRAPKTAAPKYQAPEVLAAPNPIGTIIASEGLDVCIWKVMADRKTRTVEDIGLLLAEFGINRVSAKDRVIILFRRGWFDKSGSGKKTSYTLKKNILMPTIKKEVATPTKTAEPTKAVHRTPMTVTRAPAKAVYPAPAPTLSAEDRLNTSIWKVTSDHKPYTVADLALLLGEIGIKPTTVSSMLSKLHLEKGWFDRTGNRAIGFSYTLKRTIKCPVNEKPYNMQQRQVASSTPPQPTYADKHGLSSGVVKSSTVPVPKVEPVASTATQTLTPKETPMVANHSGFTAPSPSLAQQFQATAVQPLVSISVKIKGMDFSVDEARALATDLLNAGFGTNKVQKTPAPSMLSVSVTIKGVVFSSDEVNEIATALVMTGFTGGGFGNVGFCAGAKKF